jgi:hypothetical protein
MVISAKTTLVVLLALALLAPAARAQTEDPEPAITEQPTDVARPNVVGVEWAGEEAQVFVERSQGEEWVIEADEETGDVLVEAADEEGAWYGHWQPTYESPAGTYRIRIAGEAYELTSDEFKVRRCKCIFPNPVRAGWRDGRWLIRVTARYMTEPPEGFLELPTRVTTGRARVRVYRDARAIDTVRLRYRNGKFRGKWRGRKGPPDSMVFQLISLKDRWGNR